MLASLEEVNAWRRGELVCTDLIAQAVSEQRFDVEPINERLRTLRDGVPFDYFVPRLAQKLITLRQEREWIARAHRIDAALRNGIRPDPIDVQRQRAISKAWENDGVGCSKLCSASGKAENASRAQRNARGQTPRGHLQFERVLLAYDGGYFYAAPTD